MKKFNSFFESVKPMTILAIAAVALTSVLGFTSCDKADEPFDSCPNPQPIPVQQQVQETPSNNDNTYNNESTSTTSEVKASTVKDFVGTYKYTAEDGKEWVLVITENAGNKENHYYASVTVPEGSEVEAKTYDGQYRIGIRMAAFNSYEKSGGKINYSTVGCGIQLNQDNPNNVTVTFRLNGNLVNPVVFVKQ